MRTRRQHFGQHFLCDEKVIERISSAMLEEFQKYPDHGLLEIGPGKGALTFPVLKKIGETEFPPDWVLVEKDPKLSAFWERELSTFPATQRPNYIEMDFLKFDGKSRAQEKNLPGFYLYSNLPYSTGTLIFQKLTDENAAFPAMTLMFQKEVADRIQAKPGTKAWGSLSLYSQNVWEVERILDVPPEAFKPPPKVISTVLRFRKRERELFDFSTAQEKKFWFSLIRRLFNHRRKMIRAILKSPEDADRALLQALEQAKLSPQLRAETLDFDAWQQWLLQYRKLAGAGSFSTEEM